MNGKKVAEFRKIFDNQDIGGFFAAASFMSFQQCQFNFGGNPFKHPPKKEEQFKSFNDHAELSEEQKQILPRHLKLEMLRRVSVKDDACTLCFDRRANAVIEPCEHRGFCMECCSQVENCPMCRQKIDQIVMTTSNSSL